MPSHCHAVRLFVAAGCVLLTAGAAAAIDVPVEGFTEPFRTVQVASSEMGLLTSLLVKAGDHVTSGQPLGALDDDLQRSQLAIAQLQADARGQLNAALAELALHQRRFEKLTKLREAGQAHAEEVERARADVQVADSKVLAEQEQQRLLLLQLEKYRLQLSKRTILSPLDGVVAELHRQVGEFVSPNTPQVLTVVELHPLKATFLVTRAQLSRLKLLQRVKVQFVEAGQKIEATVDSIAPITDAESGTTAVSVRIANPNLTFRSGERCRLELP